MAHRCRTLRWSTSLAITFVIWQRLAVGGAAAEAQEWRGELFTSLDGNRTDRLAGFSHLEVANLADQLICSSTCGSLGMACPLIVALHGANDDDGLKMQRSLSRRDQISIFASKTLCIFFATARSGGNWNISDPEAEARGVASATEAIIAKHKINRELVFLVGVSLGGVSGYTMMCGTSHASLFKGFAAVSAQVPLMVSTSGNCCDRTGFHLFVAHGTADDSLGYAEKEPWACTTPPGIADQYAKSIGCFQVAASSSANVNNADFIAYDEGCPGAGSAALLRVNNAGHNILGNPVMTEILDYMMEHAMKKPPEPTNAPPPTKRRPHTIEHLDVHCVPACGWKHKSCPLVVALRGEGDLGAVDMKHRIFGSCPPFQDGDFCIFFARPASERLEWDVSDVSAEQTQLIQTTRSLISELNIDRSAVHLFGLGAGGRLAYKTMCSGVEDNPFVSLAAVSTQIPWSMTGTGERFCCPSDGWHLLHAHSESDPDVSFHSREEWGCATPADTSALIGYSNNGCSGPTESLLRDGVKRLTFNQSCSGTGSATLYRFTQSAHNILSEALWRDIWDFFTMYRTT